jgi:hypothetical protein
MKGLPAITLALSDTGVSRSVRPRAGREAKASCLFDITSATVASMRNDAFPIRV